MCELAFEIAGVPSLSSLMNVPCDVHLLGSRFKYIMYEVAF